MHNIAPMTEDQEAIRDAVAAVCSQFDAESVSYTHLTLPTKA